MDDSVLLLAAIMRTLGLSELRIPENALQAMPRGEILQRRVDPLSDEIVFTLNTPGEAIEGEEAPILPLPAALP